MPRTPAAAADPQTEAAAAALIEKMRGQPEPPPTAEAEAAAKLAAGYCPACGANIGDGQPHGDPTGACVEYRAGTPEPAPAGPVPCPHIFSTGRPCAYWADHPEWDHAEVDAVPAGRDRQTVKALRQYERRAEQARENLQRLKARRTDLDRQRADLQRDTDEAIVTARRFAFEYETIADDVGLSRARVAQVLTAARKRGTNVEPTR